MLLPTIADEKERHTAAAREEQRSAGPEGAYEFSQGWSEAQPLVRKPPGTHRPGRGGRTDGRRASAPAGAVLDLLPVSRGSASLHPWLHLVAPLGRIVAPNAEHVL